jgi:hypothetical protein
MQRPGVRRLRDGVGARVNVEGVAKAMFERQAASYADPALIELAWLDPGIWQFWIDEATAVLTLLGEM